MNQSPFFTQQFSSIEHHYDRVTSENYYEGITDNPNVKIFNKYLENAKKLDVIAQFNVGLMYATGHGVKKDKAEAFKWYQMASDQGDIDAQKALKKLKKKLKMN